MREREINFPALGQTSRLVRVVLTPPGAGFFFARKGVISMMVKIGIVLVCLAVVSAFVLTIIELVHRNK